MKKIPFLLLLLITCFGCETGQDLPPIKREQVQIKIFPMDCSIRAITAIDEHVVWFGGSKGQYGYTTDGGASWMIDSIQHAKKDDLEFRGIAKTSEALFLLAVGSPALLFKTENEGRSWKVVYEEDHPSAFYDAIAFWDDQNGIAMGDPTDACLSVILTRDGGDSWTKIPCDRLPSSAENEAAFAASNSNIALIGDHAWIVSGGGKARVFHSPDRGETWEVFDTPIIQGGKMTGIFTASFYDEKRGVIFGGDWENQAQNTNNKAITHDGGKTWQLMADGQDPGYRSSVQFLPKTEGQGLIAVGIPGISYSADGGQEWVALSDRSFYTMRVCDSGKAAWLAGKEKMGKMTW
jgi:photosystem II stability/assembly factor-like uncharacterized protein